MQKFKDSFGIYSSEEYPIEEVVFDCDMGRRKLLEIASAASLTAIVEGRERKNGFQSAGTHHPPIF